MIVNGNLIDEQVVTAGQAYIDSREQFSRAVLVSYLRDHFHGYSWDDMNAIVNRLIGRNRTDFYLGARRGVYFRNRDAPLPQAELPEPALAPTPKVCLSCERPFTSYLDDDLCGACVNEAYRHRPERFVRVRLVGGGVYTQRLDELAGILIGEIQEAAIGTRWELELLEMSQAEYDALPEFTGH